MYCPYCKAEFELFTDVDAVFKERGYGLDGECWDEYRCECPECGKEFRAFEDYIYTGQSSMKMED